MFSEFFIQTFEGDVLFSKTFRPSSQKEPSKLFFQHVLAQSKLSNSFVEPILKISETFFAHITNSNLYLVLVTEDANISPLFVLDFLHHLARLCSKFCGGFTPEIILLNFVLLRELMEEVFDFGYPQLVDFDILKQFVLSEKIPSAISSSLNFSFIHETPPKNNPDFSRFSDGFYDHSKKNSPGLSFREDALKISPQSSQSEIFVDIIETLSVTMSQDGKIKKYILQASVETKSQGLEKCKFLLGFQNNFQLKNQSGSFLMDAKTKCEQETSLKKSIYLDEISFHQNVDTKQFLAQKIVGFFPPLQEKISIMAYQISDAFFQGISVPFHFSIRKEPLIIESENMPLKKLIRVEFQLSATFPSSFFAKNLIVSFQIPKLSLLQKQIISEDVSCVQSLEVSEGDFKTLAAWKISSLQGGFSRLLELHFSSSSDGDQEAISSLKLGDISVAFEIPMYTPSGISVKFLKNCERLKNSSLLYRWIRYHTKSSSFIIYSDD
eukprot:Sdes_comp16136_c0_seq1m5382